MKLLIPALSAIALALTPSPAAAGPYDGYSSARAADGFMRPEPEHVKTVFVVKMEYFDRWEDLAAKYEELTGESAGKKLYAFSALRDKGCTIYTMNPEVIYHPEFVGHELMHCSLGRWH